MNDLEERRQRAQAIVSDHAKARVEVHRMWTNVVVLAMVLGSVWGGILLGVWS